MGCVRRAAKKRANFVPETVLDAESMIVTMVNLKRHHDVPVILTGTTITPPCFSAEGASLRRYFNQE